MAREGGAGRKGDDYGAIMTGFFGSAIATGSMWGAVGTWYEVLDIPYLLEAPLGVFGLLLYYFSSHDRTAQHIGRSVLRYSPPLLLLRIVRTAIFRKPFFLKSPKQNGNDDENGNCADHGH
jgi:hypothetical protein